MKLFAIIAFAVTYALLLVFPSKRSYIALASAAAFVISGVLPIGDVLTQVDWNVIMMLAGTMGIVYFFIESKMPARLADIIIQKMPDVKWAIVSLALFAGIISAFIDNVSTVLMVAPIALNIAKKLKISPVPGIIAIAVSANLQGAATLVGDTTSIMLAGKDYANLNFFQFFIFKGKIGMFFIVEAGALVSMLILLLIFRKENKKISVDVSTKVEDYFPTGLILSVIILLIMASFVNTGFSLINGTICMSLFIIGLLRTLIMKNDRKMFLNALKEIDYLTLLLLASLFVVIGGIESAGIIKDLSNLFYDLSGNNLFLIYTLIVWGSVLLSAFIDNIPYVATMLPVVAGIASVFGVQPYLLYFGLLTGATLGGNLTPIGASANIAGIGILRKEGYEVKTGQFMKIGVPFTLAAVATGYILIWLIWS